MAHRRQCTCVLGVVGCLHMLHFLNSTYDLLYKLQNTFYNISLKLSRSKFATEYNFTFFKIHMLNNCTYYKDEKIKNSSV